MIPSETIILKNVPFTFLGKYVLFFLCDNIIPLWSPQTQYNYFPFIYFYEISIYKKTVILQCQTQYWYKDRSHIFFVLFPVISFPRFVISISSINDALLYRLALFDCYNKNVVVDIKFSVHNKFLFSPINDIACIYRTEFYRVKSTFNP